MLREIKGVQQRRQGERRRWFQDDFFDLYTLEAADGELQWFQLCYLRDTWHERVLEWRRGRGFAHLKVKQPLFAADRESGVLAPDGVLPYVDVMEAFHRSSAGLPQSVAAFIAERVREYARPDRKYRRPQVRPRWLRRLRERRL